MRHLLPLLCVPALIVPSAASAEPAAPRPDWNVGVGLFSPYSISYSFGLLGYSPYQPRIFGAGVEWRMGGDTWLTFDAFGGYHRDTSGDDAATDASLGGTVGVRQALNADDPFVLSVLAAIGARYGHTESTAHAYVDEEIIEIDSTVRSLSLHANGGVAIDHELSEGLALRIGLGLVWLSYRQETATAMDGSGDDVDGDGVSLTFGFEPRLDLRYAF